MKSLIIIFVGIAFSSFAQGGLIRDTIIGKFSKSKETVSIGQQVAQQGAGYSFEVERAYLKVGGQEYKIYRLTKKQIMEIDPPSENPQQTQRRPEALGEDYFLRGNFEANEKFVVIEGFMDKEKKIIYEAKLISTLSEEDIVEALNKCLKH